ncbi:bifunctional hydroxymethylpyrimidine kinase/phosphomethylpyrimidine kinase [Streptococcus sp. sy018]|uniref:bifunctional hydroxymethylpyrimidine kinase/phosphomethylpyrimidine kinase n=1 Tax=Streptococcus sp. sy018 TaxID=2600147 RepID=UPI0011B3A7F5|nr:bifunctional hydroxymethylpyrimidine kinase/phosphomethylpyrimidine kinase [Streptococcus sp. sy018]TWS94098.1 bifunctional hydroxymethylpyrimidine kinase/phosphomethylpyrimidine kinase [Streptococcus sp. sy018]
MKTKYILAISGSDILSGGGMQADLATFTHHGLFGFVALTSLATINGQGFEIHALSDELLAEQLTSLEDVPFSAVKLGLLPNPAVANRVLDMITARSTQPIVLDPVLVFKENGDDQISQMRAELLKFFPYVSIITPNLREAEILSGISISSLSDMKQAAQKLYELGANQVVIKGGTRLDKTQAIDLYYDGKDFYELALPILQNNNNGAGCTFAASLASQLALGQPMFDAIKAAKSFVHQAIQGANDYGVQYENK